MQKHKTQGLSARSFYGVGCPESGGELLIVLRELPTARRNLLYKDWLECSLICSHGAAHSDDNDQSGVTVLV